MSRFSQKGKRNVPQPNSGSLSDIVFMLLFFFMVTTTMRDTQNHLDVSLPSGSEIAKLEDKQLTSYIYIGAPNKSLQSQYGTGVCVQLNDAIKEVADIYEFISAERDALDEVDKQNMTVAIKADKDTRMGIVSDVKQELRKSSALKISYIANRAAK